MKCHRGWKRALSAGVTGAGLALLVSGCTVESGKPIVVLEAERVGLSEGTDEADRCATPTSSGNPLEEGTLDVALDKDYSYTLYPVVQNRLPSLQESGFEINEVSLTSAEVEIEPPLGLKVPWSATCGPKFELPIARRVQPGAETVLRIEAMRSCHSALFRQLFGSGAVANNVSERVVFRTKVTIKGRHGSSSVSSDEFAFNVRVCYGCLHSNFSPEFGEFDHAVQGKILSCDQIKPGFVNPYKGNACAPGQDVGPILCCARGGDVNRLVCPAPDGAPVETTP